jgi:hypothetical protein
LQLTATVSARRRHGNEHRWRRWRWWRWWRLVRPRPEHAHDLDHGGDARGQTLAVGGLLQTNLGADTQRVPGIGDLPIIGHIARFDRTSASESELVLLVTPELVHPLEPHERRRCRARTTSSRATWSSTCWATSKGVAATTTAAR